MKIYLDEGAEMPIRAHSTDAGLDLKSREPRVIPPGESAVFNTGVHIELPKGCVGFVKSRSGLNIHSGLQCEGVIDEGYKGAITIKLYNHSDERVYVEAGQRIGQLVILPVIKPTYTIAESLDELYGGDTERGGNGFGSTGI